MNDEEGDKKLNCTIYEKYDMYEQCSYAEENEMKINVVTLRNKLKYLKNLEKSSCFYFEKVLNY